MNTVYLNAGTNDRKMYIFAPLNSNYKLKKKKKEKSSVMCLARTFLNSDLDLDQMYVANEMYLYSMLQ